MTIEARPNEPFPGEAATEPYFSPDGWFLFYEINVIDSMRLDLANPLDALLAKEDGHYEFDE